MNAAASLRPLILAGLLLSVVAGSPGQARAADPDGSRYIVTARNATDYASAKAALAAQGARIVSEMPAINVFVVVTPAGAAGPASVSRMASTAGVASMVPDQALSLSPPDKARKQNLKAPGLRSAKKVTLPAAATAADSAAAKAAITPDPAFRYKGLLWDYERIGLPKEWKTTAGSPAVTVGVADTGIDFTHADLKAAVKEVQDFTADDQPSRCATTDQELADFFGGPVNTDWNGHGSWVGGNVAASLDRTGVNGIAPKVRLVALKIAENCGSAYTSSILQAILWAADNDLDIVNISFGGYLDRAVPAGETTYQIYQQVVTYARDRGTLIVASAGNEHVRVGAGGQVLSHGSLTNPGDALDDLYDLYEVPGGLNGVVNVAATGNLVNGYSANCSASSLGSAADGGLTATCKPVSDPHQPIGQGLKDQLAYYSNYGPRIDVAAPGGARKFNLPAADRGGTPGFPYVTRDLTNAWETFSTTSNFATDVDCFTFSAGGGFPERQCYATIQGTSMAAPHVAAVLALIASAKPKLRGKPDALVSFLKKQTRKGNNKTPALSATDLSPGDLTGVDCTTGYCHLGGPAISSKDAFGAGIIEVDY